MKVIFEKQAYQMAQQLTTQLKVLFKSQGKTLTQAQLLYFEYKVFSSLGGKKKNYQKYKK